MKALVHAAVLPAPRPGDLRHLGFQPEHRPSFDSSTGRRP